MRVWEFGDNNAAPSDLVREQDFILRVRRMQRQATPSLVLNFILTAIEPLVKDHDLLEETQKKLQKFASGTGGGYYEMSNGDAFVAWDKPGEARIVTNRALDEVLPEYKANTNQFILTYRMPESYTLLRERTNYYIETARAAGSVGSGFGLVNESIGRLTAKNVDQIEQLLGEVDMRRYGRTQNIYRDNGGKWEQVGEEYFISFEDLRRERFPKLEITASEHFFFAICGMLDQKLLAMLTSSYETIAERKINLNLTVASIAGNVFAKFVHRVPRDQRGLIGFELHRGDIFQDFPLTLSAIEVLKREGFRVAIDGITPDMINYVNFSEFGVDTLKINVSKDRVMELNNPHIRLGLERLPPEKLIFIRSDNEHALTLGRKLGVSVFQGWLIDDLSSKKN